MLYFLACLGIEFSLMFCAVLIALEPQEQRPLPGIPF